MTLNAFTVDVEEYFQVHNFESRIERTAWRDHQSRLERPIHALLELLETHGTRGTFFVLTWNTARIQPIVRAVHAAGHEIASHGCSHRLVYEQTPEEFREDIRRSKSELEDWIGGPVLGYRAPSYSVTRRSLWAVDELREAGFVYDSSIYPIRRRRYGIPDAPRVPHRRQGIAELPLATWRILGRNLPAATGAYLRLFPLAVSVAAIRQLNHQGAPAVVNVHPWELDPEQPRVRGGQLGGFTHYVNLRHTRGRLRSLLERFRFASARECLERAGLLERPDSEATPVAR